MLVDFCVGVSWMRVGVSGLVLTCVGVSRVILMLCRD